MAKPLPVFIFLIAALLPLSGLAASMQGRAFVSDDATIALYHFERILAGGRIYDSGPLALHGLATESVKLVPGKFKRCLAFNGVDSAMLLRRKVALSAIVGASVEFWLCPATSPAEPVAETFAKVFAPGEHRFTLAKVEYFARHGESAETGAVWGVHFWKEPKVQVRGREGADMYIMCCDSPFSSARQQLFLRRKDGRLAWRGTGGFGKAGKLEYRSMLSRSAVWKKDCWSHVKIEYAPYPGEFRMFVNGALEANAPLQALPPSHTFILGASLQNGVPFAGRIDELRVRRIVAPERLAFPYGTMESRFYEYGPGVELPAGFMPVGLVPQQDRAGADERQALSGAKALRLELSSAGRGVVALVSPFLQGDYRASLSVKGAGGEVVIKQGHSLEYKLSAEAASGSLDNTWRRFEFLLAGRYVFVVFTLPGVYLVDDFAVTESALGGKESPAAKTESVAPAPPEKAFGKNDATALLWHLDRGPAARSAFAGGPSGKVRSAKWVTNGRFRACLDFGGATSVVETAALAAQLPGRRTELWLAPVAAGGSKARVVWHEIESPGCESALLLEPDGTLRYQRVYTGTNREAARSRLKVPFGRWSHVAVDIDAPGKTVRFFISGKRAGEGEMPLSESISRFGLGGVLGGGMMSEPSFAGRIDEVRIRGMGQTPAD